MAIKIIKKPSHLYRMECPICYALLEYSYHDIECGSIKCPCCSTWNEHSVFGKPAEESEGEG